MGLRGFTPMYGRADCTHLWFFSSSLKKLNLVNFFWCSISLRILKFSFLIIIFMFALKICLKSITISFYHFFYLLHRARFCQLIVFWMSIKLTSHPSVLSHLFNLAALRLPNLCYVLSIKSTSFGCSIDSPISFLRDKPKARRLANLIKLYLQKGRTQLWQVFLFY